MILTEDLKRNYQLLFSTMKITNEVDTVNIVNKILKNKSRYDEVSKKTKVPWYFIALVHNMECSLDFNKHLHNGDPLTGKTTHVPKGRPSFPPANGKFYTWEESSIDAVKEYRIPKSLSELLFTFEGFNGYGYLMYHKNVNSPYLWSGSDKYTKGKYQSDGKFNPELISRQIGVAVILKKLQEMQVIKEI